MKLDVPQPKVLHPRLDGFRKRFGEAHLHLAYHAALPLALTPDLLYRLWANFQQDVQGEMLNVPWVAVADLLLSSLCEEVGHELYEMDRDVRAALLEQLKQDDRFGQPHLQELSDFLLIYIRQDFSSTDLDTRDIAQAQKFSALAYAQPENAAHEIATTLSQLSLNNKTEWIRMASLLDRLASPLRDFQSLFSYANAMAALARGDVMSAAAQLAKVVDASKQIRVAGVSLLIPAEIRANLITSDSSRSDQKIASIANRYRWLIALSTGTVMSVALLTGIIYALHSSQPPDSSPNAISSLTPSPLASQIAPETSLLKPNAAAGSPLKPGTTSSATSLSPQLNPTTSESSKSSTYPSASGSTSGTSVPITPTPSPQTNSTLRSVVVSDRKSFWVSSLVFSSDGRSLACGGRYEVKGQTAGTSNGFRLWNVDYGKQALTIKSDPRIFGDYEGVVRSVAFSPDGRTLATGDYDTTIKLWNLQLSDTQPLV